MSDNAPRGALLSTVDRVAEELRRALFEGELVPGTPLREVALADSLGVARSTVRESLGVLVGEGLADRVPNKGTVVRALTPIAIRDICRSRLVLESAGVARWDEASQGSRGAVRTALDRFGALAEAPSSSPADFTARHLDIHRGLVGLTESPRLIAMADSLYAEIKLALASLDRERGNAEEQVASHALLVGLLEDGDVPAALAELEAHLADAEVSIIDSLGWPA